MEKSYAQDINHEWLVEATINDLQKVMESGQLTSKQLVLMYLERIALYDTQGPAVNAVLEVNPDALQIAEALDFERAKKGPRGPMHGIPVLVKDNIDTYDKMHTSAGSLALENSIAPEDSFVASQLRKAGAVILGKANMTEWANFMTENMPNGFSSRGGQVLNPYGPGTMDVGGSSSGSGASVAANLTAVAIGTETSGSILSPASANSIVGIKPTVGLISRSGIIPIAHSQDTAGPMARTVSDAAILLGALTGIDEQDPVTMTSEGRSYTDYTTFLDAHGLKGARIGVAREAYYEDLDEDQLAIMHMAIDKLKSEGAVIVDPVTLPSSWSETGYEVLIYEFKPDLNAYLNRLNPNVSVHSLKDLIAFNESHAEKTLQYGQTTLIESEKTSGTLTDPLYIDTLIKNLHFSQALGIDTTMKEHNLDAILFPANFGASISAKAGYPSVTVPGGYMPSGKPFGVTFTGGAFSEPRLIKIAFAFEQATQHRIPPTL